jgi:hypothetical protein
MGLNVLSYTPVCGAKHLSPVYYHYQTQPPAAVNSRGSYGKSQSGNQRAGA